MILTILEPIKNKYVLIACYFSLLILIIYLYLYNNVSDYITDVYYPIAYESYSTLCYNLILKNVNIFQNYVFSYFNDKASLSIISYIDNKIGMMEISNEINVIQMLLYEATRYGSKGTFHLL